MSCGLSRIAGVLVGVMTMLLASAPACTGDPGDADGPDTRLVTHAVVENTVSEAGLAYARELAKLHRRADADPAHAAAILRDGLALAVPAADARELEILRLELAARLCETLRGQPGGATEAVEILTPMLAVEHSLPLHRSSARALVALGDAAVATGDDALAASSYARAIRMMSMLREELEP